MFDHSVYAALNGCSETGLEKPHKQEVFPNGEIVRVYVDNFGQYRAVIFKSEAHNVGYSGVLLNPDLSIRWMHTAPQMRKRGTVKQLLGYMAYIGIKWRMTEYLTDAGKATFKIVENSC